MLHNIEFECSAFDEDVIIEAELVVYPALEGAESDWDSRDGYDIFSFNVYDTFDGKLIHKKDEDVLKEIDKYIRDVTITRIMKDNAYF